MILGFMSKTKTSWESKRIYRRLRVSSPRLHFREGSRNGTFAWRPVLRGQPKTLVLSQAVYPVSHHYGTFVNPFRDCRGISIGEASRWSRLGISACSRQVAVFKVACALAAKRRCVMPGAQSLTPSLWYFCKAHKLTRILRRALRASSYGMCCVVVRAADGKKCRGSLWCSGFPGTCCTPCKTVLLCWGCPCGCELALEHPAASKKVLLSARYRMPSSDQRHIAGMQSRLCPAQSTTKTINS